jgi:NADH-quinone oxidoreductase subunit J
MLFATENVAQHVGFGIIAAVMIVGALRVVTSNNMVRAALWLVVVLSGAAAQYILLAAEFVAVTQVLVYVGAVMVLFLFGTMLTRALIGFEKNLNNANRVVPAVIALALAGVLGYVLIDTYHAAHLPAGGTPVTTAAISDSIFSTYLLPFWALSIVLTAAVVGAIVLARKD